MSKVKNHSPFSKSSLASCRSSDLNFGILKNWLKCLKSSMRRSFEPLSTTPRELTVCTSLVTSLMHPVASSSLTSSDTNLLYFNAEPWFFNSEAWGSSTKGRAYPSFNILQMKLFAPIPSQ